MLPILKRLVKFILESFGINLAFRSQSLGMTPFVEIVQLLKRLTPHNYGLKEIRIGSDFDGGYVVPEDFEGVTECFSPACAGYWHFEKFLQDNYGIHSHICDSEILDLMIYLNFRISSLLCWSSLAR